MIIFDKHIEMAMELSERDRNRFLGMVAVYTYANEEPDPSALAKMPAWLRAMWVGAKADIDTYRKNAENGKKGAAAKLASQAEAGQQANADPATKGAGKGATKGAGNPPSKPATEGASKPPAKQDKDKDKDINTPLSNARADSPVLIVEDEAPEAHTLDEVRGAFFSQGFGDGEAAQAFYDFYAAQGWAYGNGRPITDINAAARRWMREEGRRAKPPAQRQQVPAKAPEMDWSGFEDADAYLDRVEAERRARDGGQ